MKAAMKKELMRKWVLGMRFCNVSNSKHNIFEKKNIIKMTADVAMAASSKSRSFWSKALISNVVTSNPNNTQVVEHILGKNPVVFPCSGSVSRTRRVKRKKIKSRANSARMVARRMVEKRKEVLRKLIPGGGEIMEECRLIEEAMSYIMCLKAQVHVMQLIANSYEEKERGFV